MGSRRLGGSELYCVLYASHTGPPRAAESGGRAGRGVTPNGLKCYGAHTVKEEPTVEQAAVELPRFRRRRYNTLLTFQIMTGVALLGLAVRSCPGPIRTRLRPPSFRRARARTYPVIAQTAPLGSPSRRGARLPLRELTALWPSNRGAESHRGKLHIWVFPRGNAGKRGARLQARPTAAMAFLLMAHYDSMPTSLGASDGGAGVAALLETLRAIKVGPPLRNDVIFLFTDGEERGLLGARAFVDSHPWADDVGVVLNLAARGYTGPAYMFETSDEGGWIVQEVAKAAPYPLAASDAVAFYKLTGGDTDLSVFLNAGWAGLNVEYLQGYTHYHSRLDNAEELDERSLQPSLVCPALKPVRQRESRSARDPTGLLTSSGPGSLPEGWAIPFMAVVVALRCGGTSGFEEGS